MASEGLREGRHAVRRTAHRRGPRWGCSPTALPRAGGDASLATVTPPRRRQEWLIRGKPVFMIALEVAAVRGADTVRAGDARGSSAGDRCVAVAGIPGVAASQPLPKSPLHGVPGAQRHRDPDVAPTAVLERRLHPGLGMAE